MSQALSGLHDAVCNGSFRGIEGLVQEALDAGHTALEILNLALAKGLEEAGARFERGEHFLPNLMMAAKAMSSAMAVIQGRLATEGAALVSGGTFVIGTIQGDIHSIGKEIVAAMLEASGFRVVDLGVDVKPQAFVDRAVEHSADIIGISALMTTTMTHQQKVIEILKEQGLRDRFRVIVGGAPATASWAQRIGADDFATDAVSGVRKARRFVER
ncbi:MAG: cobalamin-binding protein [Armatimonadetes bacterium]|nr:cobalamin-binding protein [Armatimonadota bacterium]